MKIFDPQDLILFSLYIGPSQRCSVLEWP